MLQYAAYRTQQAGTFVRRTVRENVSQYVGQVTPDIAYFYGKQYYWQDESIRKAVSGLSIGYSTAALHGCKG